MKTRLNYAILLLALMIIGSTQIQAAGASEKTIINLRDAFIGETTASAKYAAYAKKASEEGLHRIALMFKATSKAESIHAENHKAAIQQLGGSLPDVDPQFEVKSTKENLDDAINGESYEIATMYPNFIKKAQEEKVTLALISLNYAYQTEKKHKALYAKAIKALQTGTDQSLSDIYSVCSTCGNTYDTEAPARCGISMTPKERFIQFTL